MSARSVLFLLFPWLALAVVVVFAFTAQVRAREAEAAARADAREAQQTQLVQTVLDDFRLVDRELVPVAPPPAPRPPPAVSRPAPDFRARAQKERALRAVAEARVRALEAELAALASALGPPERLPAPAADPGDATALAARLLSDPGLASEITDLVALAPPSAGTDALVVDVVTRSTNRATAISRLDRLGFERVLRPAVLRGLLTAEAEHVRDALDAWIAAREARWGRLERERVERARAAARDDR